MLINPNDYWFWSDPRLRVEITTPENEPYEADSARFILITAPMDPSRVVFSVPGWMEWVEWDSPFENVRIIDRPWTRTDIIFPGLCREPGIARVRWQHQDAVPIDVTPTPGFELTSVHPNPFNSSTVLNISVPRPMEVRLLIFDAFGRTVIDRTITYSSSGFYRIQFNADQLSAGVYLANLIGDQLMVPVKLVCVKWDIIIPLQS